MRYLTEHSFHSYIFRWCCCCCCARVTFKNISKCLLPQKAITQLRIVITKQICLKCGNANDKQILWLIRLDSLLVHNSSILWAFQCHTLFFSIYTFYLNHLFFLLHFCHLTIFALYFPTSAEKKKNIKCHAFRLICISNPLAIAIHLNNKFIIAAIALGGLVAILRGVNRDDDAKVGGAQ